MKAFLENVRRFPREAVDFLRFLGQELTEDRCQESAAALTYLTLFAVVPLLTVSVLILAAVPQFNSLQQTLESLIFTHFLPSSGEEVQSYLLQAAGNARRLSIPGILILISSAFLMLKNIEKTFNRIWRTRENRRGVTSFLLYWAILSLGPVLIGIGSLISTYLTSQALLSSLGFTATVRTTLLSWMPLLLSTMTFTLLFTAVPNCRVPLRDAALGGLITAVLFECGKKVFAWAVSLSSYEVVYGAFAALPLFLLWIYLSWLLVLAGAEFVRALSSFQSWRSRSELNVPIAMSVLERFYKAQLRGEALSEADLLQGRWVLGQSSLGIQAWERLRNVLLDARIIRVSGQGDFLLSRNLSALRLSDLYHLLIAPGLHTVNATDSARKQAQAPAWYKTVCDLTMQAENALLDVLNAPVADFFEDTDEEHKPQNSENRVA